MSARKIYTYGKKLKKIGRAKGEIRWGFRFCGFGHFLD